MDAVQDTIEERRGKGKHGFVNPKAHTLEDMEIDTIEFDVAVTAASRTSGSFTLGVSWPYTRIEDTKRLVRADQRQKS